VFLTVLTSFSIILSACYSIWLLNRLSFGFLKTVYFKTFQDISRREFWILIPLVFLVLCMGLFPNYFLKELHFSVSTLLEHCTNF
jgi:NADH:ubiquinone oxidoreductase subunit 4 (subunit M)